MKKQKIMAFVMFSMLFVLWVAGCSKAENIEKDYLRCNATSAGNMAEIESGFFYKENEILYYADKENMNNWIPVCNNPDCLHNSSSCSAQIDYEIAQKGDKLYYYDNFSKAIMEVAIDGSEPKTAFKIALENANLGNSSRGIISQDGFFIYYGYLTQDGMYQRMIARLEDDGTLYPLFTENVDSLESQITMPSYIYYVRGDFAIISSLLIEEGDDAQNVLWRVDGDEPERVNLPEEVSILYSYLSEDTFTYYREKEGFFEIDLESGKETLLCENQLEDGRGYILTDEYMIESNRYRYYTPEEAYLKFFNGKEWLDVALPENVKKTDCVFIPASVASDRIFMIQANNGVNGYASQLYYFMLNDETPELTFCNTFGTDSYFEVKTSNDENKISLFQEVDVTIFDTEEYFMKVTGIGVDPDNAEKYIITIYCENKSSKKEFSFHVDSAVINGVQCSLNFGVYVKAGETVEDTVQTTKEILQKQGIVSESDMSDFNNIILSAYVYDTDIQYVYNPDTENDIGSDIVHIYPYGEENTSTIVRESTSTDKIIIDNEYVTVLIVDYWEGDVAVDSGAKYVIVNKTDKRLGVMWDKVYSINGESIDSDFKEFSHAVILPYCYKYCNVGIPNDDLKRYNIKVVEEYDVLMRIFYSDVWCSATGEDLVNELITIKP